MDHPHYNIGIDGSGLFCWYVVFLEINLDRPPPGMVGTIDQTCNILNVAEDAYDAASGLCDGQGKLKKQTNSNDMQRYIF